MASKKKKFRKSNSPRLSNTQADIHSNNFQPNASKSANLYPARNSMNTTETLRPVINAKRIQSSNNPNQTYTPSSCVAINVNATQSANSYSKRNSMNTTETIRPVINANRIQSSNNPNQTYTPSSCVATNVNATQSANSYSKRNSMNTTETIRPVINANRIQSSNNPNQTYTPSSCVATNVNATQSANSYSKRNSMNTTETIRPVINANRIQSLNNPNQTYTPSSCVATNINATQSANSYSTRNSMNTAETIRPVINANRIQSSNNPNQTYTPSSCVATNINATQSANSYSKRKSMNTTETIRPVINANRIQSANNPNQTYTPSSCVATNIASYVASNLRTKSNIIQEAFEFAVYGDGMPVNNPNGIYHQHHITSRNLRLLKGDTVTWRRNLNLPINSNVVPQESPHSVTNSLQNTCNQQTSKSAIENIFGGMLKYFNKKADNAHQNTVVSRTTSSTSKISTVVPPRANNSKNKGAQVQEIVIGQPCSQCNNCKGYEAHTWRKNCKNCKCPRDCHAVSEFAARSRIGFNSSGDTLDTRNIGYTFVPSGLTKRQQVAQYYSLLPNHEVPKIGSPGEVLRSQRLVKQLPKQDLLLTACEFVDQNQRGSYQDFVTARNEIALDVGYVKLNNGPSTCATCNLSVPSGEYCVAAMKMGQATWHPSCFRCCKCDDLLVDLVYCVYKDKIYCERHYAECLKPRCEGCDELIFSGEYTKAMNKDWHGQHFCCWQCDESLTGQRYVLRDDHPYCVSCYESVFANACEKCSRTIGIDSKDLSYKDKHWHEACFLCTTCGESLVDKQFGSKGERIYCGRCYDNQFASRCDGCNEIFRAGTKKMEYKTRQWHEKCFCCCVCKVPIGTQSFIPREQEIYCAKCYEEKFATRCIKCNKVITSGGVTYKNEPWHRECFTCTHCSKSLAGERFTSRDDKPYCAECFGELFAKRCFACNKPITGIGGTKFISFEDRHWHNDCFFCASCRTSLVGRGFITDQEDIICPDCAKQKLL